MPNGLLLETTFEHMPVGILVVSPMGTMVRINRYVFDIFGLEPMEVEGKRFGNIFACSCAQGGGGGCGESEACRLCTLRGGVMSALSTTTDVPAFTYSNKFIVKGKPVDKWFKVSIAPFTMDPGEPYAVVTLVDMSGEKDKENALSEQLRERVDELEAIMDLAPVALLMAKDPECGDMVGNRLANTLLGGIDGENFSVDTISARRYMKDGKEMAANELPMRKALSQGINVRDVEFDVMTPSGNMVTLLGSATPLRDTHGRVRGGIAALFDITRQKQLKDEMRKLADTKDEFLAMCSHEMKTPLTVVLGGLQLLSRFFDRMDSEQRGKQMQAVYGNALRMNRLVSDLLDFSRLETGNLSVDKALIDIGELISETVGDYMRNCNTHRIVLDGDMEGLYVLGDANRLVQVLNNLLTNATVHSEKGTDIRILGERNGSDILISVIDEGEGISPEDLPRLFDRYYRNPRRNKTGGMGLGLYVSMEIMRLHQGTISVESEPDKGSTFTVRLPGAGVKSASGSS